MTAARSMRSRIRCLRSFRVPPHSGRTPSRHAHPEPLGDLDFGHRHTRLGGGSRALLSHKFIGKRHKPFSSNWRISDLNKASSLAYAGNKPLTMDPEGFATKRSRLRTRLIAPWWHGHVQAKQFNEVYHSEGFRHSVVSAALAVKHRYTGLAICTLR